MVAGRRQHVEHRWLVEGRTEGRILGSRSNRHQKLGVNVWQQDSERQHW